MLTHVHMGLSSNDVKCIVVGRRVANDKHALSIKQSVKSGATYDYTSYHTEQLPPGWGHVLITENMLPYGSKKLTDITEWTSCNCR